LEASVKSNFGGRLDKPPSLLNIGKDGRVFKGQARETAMTQAPLAVSPAPGGGYIPQGARGLAGRLVRIKAQIVQRGPVQPG